MQNLTTDKLRCASCDAADVPNLSCPVCNVYSRVVTAIGEATVTAADFNLLIEANAKSTLERMNRRVRDIGTHEPREVSFPGRVALKKEGDNNPNQHHGKKNYRGYEKRKQDEEQRRRAAREQISMEGIDPSILSFFYQCYRKPLKECVADLARLNHKADLRTVLTKMLREPGFKLVCEGSPDVPKPAHDSDTWAYGMLQMVDVHLLSEAHNGQNKD